tara:strand:+ start:2122 stop:2475 length:354 start_codon:yes stop_codon:yes gene_type:complete
MGCSLCCAGGGVRRLAILPNKPLQGALAQPFGLSYGSRMETHSSPTFDALIWGGTSLSLLGLLGLVYCILRVSRAKRAGLDDDAMRAELKKVVPLNLGALFLSVIGLMIVIIGIFLG